MRNKIVILMLGVLLSCGELAQAGTWFTLDMPGASGTKIYGISGSNIVGSSSLGNFLYNMATNSWTILNTPDVINGIDGSNAVGDYGDYYSRHGFLYDGATLTTIDMPGAASTRINGIDGSNIVGYYDTGRGTLKHGFLNNGANWTTLDMPGSQPGTSYETIISDIDGSNLVGWCPTNGGASSHGFLYNLTTNIWTSLDMPVGGSTRILGINGNNLVGQYQNYNLHGFLYDGINWTTLDMPEANGHSTLISDIDDNKIVGYYYDSSGNVHGFVYTIPEPATVSFLLFGLFGIRKLKH